MLHIGLLCTQADPQLRPDMRRVVLTLAKRPGSLEKPTRPGYPGTRYRRSRHRPGSVSSTSETSGDFYSHTIGSTTSTDTTSASYCYQQLLQLSDSHGKRPMEEL
ncbi:hypothetical protein Leryth_022501 [Lithospermum erythrorhizon]|nr:hypothetical protein Leryth_022501 [Lithospermum erythrorhizon]